ncbi:carboxypeptidase B-like [Colias croceus]|uniref:carboxypeptidase B-like n=1 Tax=Colias crocea TaxID=72248 RepID=UPI001E27AD80|nr:carboxypeptidase B-like [Colias croceus]
MNKRRSNNNVKTVKKNFIQNKNMKRVEKNNVSEPHSHTVRREQSKARWSVFNVSWPKVAPQMRARKASTRMTHMMYQELEETTSPYTPLSDEDFTGKLSPYAIKEQLLRVASRFPNANVTIEVIGRTVEYNDIVMMKIAEHPDYSRHFRAEDDKYADEPPQKKIVFIVHGLNVMGISHIQCLSVDSEFSKLLSYYLKHMEYFDIYVIPLANPDGFDTALREQLWSKNMSPQSACPGVNVDRNFNVAWNASNTISSCSQQYPGSAPFTEAESKAIRDVLHKYSHKIIAYINVHAGSYNAKSYKGEAVLYPKGYTEVQTDDDKYIDLRGEIDEAMRNASFQTLSVTVDTLHSWYGKVFGTSVDYASTVYGIPYALELVMQIYDDYYMDTDETYSLSSLNEVWSRVIDVIFKSIWKNSHISENDKK